jgi:hypothetical protein
MGKVVSSAHAFDPYVYPVQRFFFLRKSVRYITRILAAAYFPDERRHKDASIDRNGGGGGNEGFMHSI